MPGRLCLVGAGKMGGALLKGWLGAGVAPERLGVVEPSARAAEALLPEPALAVVETVDALGWTEPPAAVIFAVKPQVMDDVLPAYRRWSGGKTVFLSIAAGRTLASLAKHLGADAAIVRAMPNIPAQVGRAVTVACANSAVNPEARALASSLLQAIGEVEWIEQESWLDAVTALSGSGPAYLFLFAECLARAGAEAGLPKALAERLARATVAGGGELIRTSPVSVEDLRRDVTSPGGTTEAALEVLMGAGGLQSLLTRAVEAARRRARELAE
ncbi:MAG: pyrroline-5-carboxylate reductase [Proteobacteria bacterium]|nr:pyrroline-5-carboxylate reductase [Pseudomonadota bacterium]